MLAITATNLPRLMGCNGSRLTGGSTPPVKDDTVKDEGNAAHWVVEQVCNNGISVEELIDRKAPNGVYITIDMVEHLDMYLTNATVLEQGEQSFVEIDTSHNSNNWQINGQADNIIYNPANFKLQVNDFKYGWGAVDPEMNWTLISHALGFWFRNVGMRISEITFTIYQPRPYHPEGTVRSWTINSEKLIELSHLMNNTLNNLTDQLNTGKHCSHCPAMTTCPAYRLAEMNCIEASEKAFDDKLSNDELSFELDRLDRVQQIIKDMVKAYKEETEYRLKKGEIIKDYSLETGLTNRKWSKNVSAEMMLAYTGKDITKKDLITPKQAEVLGVSKEIVASLTERNNTGVKLVRMNANAKANKLFNKT